jgi:hypothetical protein
MDYHAYFYITLTACTLLAFCCARLFGLAVARAEEIDRLNDTITRLRMLLNTYRSSTDDLPPATPVQPAERWFTDFRRQAIHLNDKKDL